MKFKSQKKLGNCTTCAAAAAAVGLLLLLLRDLKKVTSHTHEANDRKINPLEWFSTRKRKEKEGPTFRERRPPPPSSSRLRLASGVGHTIRTSAMAK